MKKKIFNAIVLGLLAIISLPAMAQPDTLTNPDRTNVFRDPKITDNNSKVLIDTSDNTIDSLLDPKKSGRNKYKKNNTDPMGESNKPIKIKRAPTDSSRTVKP